MAWYRWGGTVVPSREIKAINAPAPVDIPPKALFGYVRATAFIAETLHPELGVWRRALSWKWTSNSERVQRYVLTTLDTPLKCVRAPG
jgi:hypothetical protein